MTENRTKLKEKLNAGYSVCFNEWALDTRIKNELPLLMIISSLSAECGVCFASNSYLSKLFNCTEISISQKINKLKKFGYIDIDYEKRGCEITKRFIRLKKFLTDDYKKFKSTIKKDFKDNNTSNNKDSSNITPISPKRDSRVDDIIYIMKRIVNYHTGREPNTERWYSSIERWLKRNNIDSERCYGVVRSYYDCVGDDEYMPKVRDLRELFSKFSRLEDYFTDF